ncbi:MAG: tol-pal system YbgF family protein, partial [Halorhabdus sp.]
SPNRLNWLPAKFCPMPDCPYCEQTFDDEPAIREHLYEEHDQEALSRIDRKRVEQYIQEHGLEDEDGSEDDQPHDDQMVAREVIETATEGGVYPHDAWELGDVRDLTTDEIVDKLHEFGVEISEERFRERAQTVNSARALSEQWWEQYDIEATGYDEDFIWMSALVLWERWMPDIPNAEHADDLIKEAHELLKDGQQEDACQQWLKAWDFVLDVTPETITSLTEVDEELPGMYSVAKSCATFEMELGNAALDDTTYHEKRLEFCRTVIDRFPDSSAETLKNMRHAIGESLYGLGREDEGAAAFEAVIDDYPADAWGYVKWADLYWLHRPHEEIPVDYERAEEIYQQALDNDVGQQTVVSDRLADLQEQRGDTDETEAKPHDDA